jgi:hypothetical protein
MVSDLRGDAACISDALSRIKIAAQVLCPTNVFIYTNKGATLVWMGRVAAEDDKRC